MAKAVQAAVLFQNARRRIVRIRRLVRRVGKARWVCVENVHVDHDESERIGRASSRSDASNFGTKRYRRMARSGNTDRRGDGDVETVSGRGDGESSGAAAGEQREEQWAAIGRADRVAGT